MTDVREMTAADAGTWLDGWHGWTNGYRAVERAIEWGWTVPEEYAEGWKDFRDNHHGDHDVWADLNGDDGAFVDKATDYLQEIAPENYVFRWDDGLSLIPVWVDCEMDGGGCQMTEGFYPDGTPSIQPCTNHKPEHIIRVVFTQGTTGGAGPTVYTVMLWDEDGEILSGSTTVTYPGKSPHLMGGEHWFAEVIATPEIREAAERLLKATRCEGHVDTDDALTSGVGIGEAVYCDGSCVKR